MLTIDDLLVRIPVRTYNVPVLKTILAKVLPVLKHTTPIMTIIETLKVPRYETEFMHFIIRFTSK